MSTVYRRTPAAQSGTSGAAPAVKDEGSTVLATPAALDFVGAGVTATDGGAGVATVTIPGGGSSSSLARTAVKTANYTAAAWDLVPVDTTSGAVTITLPTAPADKTQVAVKHIIQGGSNAVTLACGGSDVFNKAGGSTTGSLTQLNQAMLLEYAAAAAVWTVLADDLPLTVLDGRYMKAGTSNVVELQRVSADQASAPGRGSFNVGSTYYHSRLRKRTPTAGGQVALEFMTTFGNSEQTLTGDGSPITIRASVEYPSGTFYPAFAVDGSRDVVVAPGTIARLYVPGLVLPAGVDYWVRTRANITATGGLPYTHYTDGVTEYTSVGSTATDFTVTTASQPAASANYAFGPSAVLYLPSTVPASVGILGDSIAAGVGDPDSLGDVKSAAAGGFLIRALSSDGTTGRSSPLIPNVQMAVAAERANFVAVVSKSSGRFQVIDDGHVTTAWVALGTNDIANSRTAAQTEADLLTIWNRLSQRGLTVVAFTLVPFTTSTDAWATLGNQTATGSNTQRVAFNQWLRAGGPILGGVPVAVGTSGALVAGNVGHPVSLVVDTGGAAESGTDSGKWRVDLGQPTTDGIHPASVIHAAMAAVAYANAVPVIAPVGVKRPVPAATDAATLLTANGKGFVNHGAAASTARPAGFASVEWFGSVTPLNAVTGDTWTNTAAS